MKIVTKYTMEPKTIGQNIIFNKTPNEVAM